MSNPAITPGLVKIIMTSYNRSHYLRLAVESALAQTYSHYHIIIVDDASPDDSGAVARDYMARYPTKVTAICKETRLGPVDSINRAFALCLDAAYIALHPDDDLWLPEKLEQQIALFVKHPQAGLVYTEAMLIDSDGKPKGQTFAERSGKFDQRNVARRIFLSGNFICAASVVVSHAAMASLDFRVPPQFRFMNDEYMWLIISSAFEVYYIEEPLTLYRISSGAVSVKYSGETHQEEFELLRYAYIHYSSIRRLINVQQFHNRLGTLALAYSQTSLRAGRVREYLWFMRRVWKFRPPGATLRWTVAITLSTVSPGLLQTLRQWKKKSRR